MSRSVDTRVTQMEFDNKQFESATRESIGTLAKLKESLKMDESVKNIQTLQDVINRTSFGPMANDISTIASRFSAWGAVGFTVISNLTTAAINLGNKMLDTFAFEGAREGFQEYETQMGAIQTVLANTASKGSTLFDVNKALNELNTYSDKTIYNFTEMAKNIGTFTAAGVDLDTSTAAIKGIANLAAVSGSTSQQASTAMYQLSQAMASGTVKLMDWNSVVNAGMGGQVFQDALKETARVHKVNIDGMIATEGSFRETLSKGWLTTNILTETLQKFTGDLTEEQLKSMGYTKEQIKQIMELGVRANDAATKVKTFSQLKSTLMEAIQSGWTQSWQLVVGDFEEAKTLFTGLSNFFGTLISVSANARNAVLGGWKDLGGRTVLVEGFMNVLKGLESIVKIIGDAFAKIFPPITAQTLYALTVGFRDLTAKLIIGGDTAKQLGRIFEGIFGIFDIARMAVGGVIVSFGKLIGAVLPTKEVFLGALTGIADFIDKVRSTIKDVSTFRDNFPKLNAALWGFRVKLRDLNDNVLYPFRLQIEKFIAPAVLYLGNVLQRVQGWLNGLQIGGLTRAGEYISTIFARGDLSFLQKISDILYQIFSGIKVDLNGPIAWLKSLIGIKADPVTAMSGALTTLSGEAKKASSKLEGIGDAFKTIKDKIKDSLSKINLGDTFSKLGTTIIESLKKIDWKQVAATLVGGIAGGFLLSVLLSAKKLIDSTSGTLKSGSGILEGVTGILDSVKGSLEAWQNSLKAKTLMTIAIAIAILAASLIALSMVDKDRLSNALAVMTLMFVELMTSLNSFSKSFGQGNMLKIGAQLLLLAAAISVLTIAIVVLGNMDPNALAQGLIGVEVALIELSLFMKSLKVTTFDPKTLGGLFALSASLVVLAIAIKMFGSMDPNVLAVGLVGVGAALIELSGFLQMVKGTKFGPSDAIGILIVAGALLVLQIAVKKFGEIDSATFQQGLMGVGIVLGELGAFIKLSGNAEKTLATAASLIIIAGAMLLFVNIITQMGSMPVEVVTQGIAALGATLLILAGALNLMKGTLAASAAMIIAAGAISLLVPALIQLGAMKWEDLGKALLGLAGIFLVFGIAGALLAPIAPALLLLGAAVLLFGLGALAAGAGLLALSVGLAGLVALGYGSIQALNVVMTTIAAGLANAILVFVQTIAAGAPLFSEAIHTVFLALMNMALTMIPEFVGTALKLILALLDELQANLPKILQAGIDLIVTLLQGISDNIERVVTVVLEIVTKFIDSIAAKLPDIIQSGVNLLLSFIEGITKAINDKSNQDRLQTAAIQLGEAIIKGAVKGVETAAYLIMEAVKNVGDAAIKAIKTVLGIHSPSTVFERFGELTDQGLANGLLALAFRVKNAATEVGNHAVAGIGNAITAISNAIDGNMDMSPTIRPVLDLSQIVAGGQQIDNLLGNGLNLSATMRKLELAASGMTIKESTPQVKPTGGDTTITLEQNNYSPESLDAVTIYRNNRRQLATLKGILASQ